MIPEGYENDDNCCPFCGFIENTMPKNVSYLRPGVMLQGRYSIGTVIGAGGFGITYKAWDNTLDTIVAIKEFFPLGVVLRDNTLSTTSTVTIYNVDDNSFEHGKERFIKEAKSLAKFNSHPGTVAIYDYFEANDTAYIVMEYLDGCNMKEYIAATESVLPFEMLKPMTESVCDVLASVHSVGLIHRDISPDNIYMCLNGTFKLIDFGSVKQGMSDSTLSATVILKHGYAPIEQYSKSGKIGPWTDIYSLGATIYKLATGKLPEESVERITSDEVVDICELNSEIPRSFGDAVMKAMSPQVKDRFQNIAEFKKAILKDNKEVFTEEMTEKTEGVTEAEILAEADTTNDKPTEKVESTESTKEAEHEPVYEKESRIKSIIGFFKTSMGRVLLSVCFLVMLGVLAIIIDPGKEDEKNTVKKTTTTEKKTEATTEAKQKATTAKKKETTTEEKKESTTESTTETTVEKAVETYIFGNYWQEDTNGDGVADQSDDKQPIEWRLYKKYDDGTAIIYSDKIIDCAKFNDTDDPTTWSESTVRNWLNNDFYYNAFSESEQKNIRSVLVKNESAGSSDTDDSVFLLSSVEANSSIYGLSEKTNRIALGTSYAKNNGLFISDKGTGMWWLRTGGLNGASNLSNWSTDNHSYAQVVLYGGKISTKGKKLTTSDIGIRPAICVDLTSSEVKKNN